MSVGGRYCSCKDPRTDGCERCELPGGGYSFDGYRGGSGSYIPRNKKKKINGEAIAATGLGVVFGTAVGGPIGGVIGGIIGKALSE